MANIRLNGQNYNGVEQVTLPTVEGGTYTFGQGSGTNKLPQLIDKTIQSVDESDFGNATEVSNYLFDNCQSLSEVTLPSTITYIRGYAFTGCQSLTNIVFPQNLEGIGE